MNNSDVPLDRSLRKHDLDELVELSLSMRDSFC